MGVTDTVTVPVVVGVVVVEPVGFGVAVAAFAVGVVVKPFGKPVIISMSEPLGLPLAVFTCAKVEFSSLRISSLTAVGTEVANFTSVVS